MLCSSLYTPFSARFMEFVIPAIGSMATQFGGGGHALAAGCTLDGPLDRAESLLIDACRAALRRQATPLPLVS